MDIIGSIKEVSVAPYYRRHSLATLEYSYAKWQFARHRIQTPHEFLEGIGISSKAALAGYARWAPILESVVRKVRSRPGQQGGISVEDGMVLFGIIRALRPKILIETGVAAGVSNSFINAALLENEVGTLYSIELPPAKSKAVRHEDGVTFAWPDIGVGWAVPPEIRKQIAYRNVLILEDVRIALPRLFGVIPYVDFFFHDDLHTPDHMLWEYETAWDHLLPGGIVVSDDANFGWIKFCRRLNLNGETYRNMQRLTAVRKPEQEGAPA
jgi:Methyltransferase domain